MNVLLVGGGHANLACLRAAKGWTRAGARVTLLSDSPVLYYSGMVPEHVGGVYGRGEVVIDLAALCEEGGVHFIEDAATGINLARRAVETAGGRLLSCDLAAFDIGGVNPGHDLAPGSLPTKPLRLIARLVDWLEETQRQPDRPRSLVVVGGGAAGTELLLNVSARIRALVREGTLRLTLVEPQGRLLPEFAPNLSRNAEKLLRERGVDLRLGGQVERGGDGEIVLKDGQHLPADFVLWATGTAGPPLFRASGLLCEERGLLRVDRTLRAESAPWLFAAGDGAAVAGLEHLERSGVHAVKQGLTLRDNLGRLVRAARSGRESASVRLAPFRPYPVAPYLMSTGTKEGMMALGRRVGLSGSPVLTLKHLLDRRFVRRYQLRHYQH